MAESTCGVERRVTGAITLNVGLVGGTSIGCDAIEFHGVSEDRQKAARCKGNRDNLFSIDQREGIDSFAVEVVEHNFGGIISDGI